jgi:hypothetical protein
MTIEPALLSPVAALVGALIGGCMSLVAAILTQRNHNRLQRIASEVAKRETVYSDFVFHASNLLLHAYTHDDFVLSGDEHRLLGLINRLRFFAPPNVVATAEAVVNSILEISLKPSVELRQLATEALLKGPHLDPVNEFARVCRADLENVRQATL